MPFRSWSALTEPQAVIVNPLQFYPTGSPDHQSAGGSMTIMEAVHDESNKVYSLLYSDLYQSRDCDTLAILHCQAKGGNYLIIQTLIRDHHGHNGVFFARVGQELSSVMFPGEDHHVSISRDWAPLLSPNSTVTEKTVAGQSGTFTALVLERIACEGDHRPAQESSRRGLVLTLPRFQVTDKCFDEDLMTMNCDCEEEAYTISAKRSRDNADTVVYMRSITKQGSVSWPGEVEMVSISSCWGSLVKPKSTLYVHFPSNDRFFHMMNVFGFVEQGCIQHHHLEEVVFELPMSEDLRRRLTAPILLVTRGCSTYQVSFGYLTGTVGVSAGFFVRRDCDARSGGHETVLVSRSWKALVESASEVTVITDHGVGRTVALDILDFVGQGSLHHSHTQEIVFHLKHDMLLQLRDTHETMSVLSCQEKGGKYQVKEICCRAKEDSSAFFVRSLALEEGHAPDYDEMVQLCSAWAPLIQPYSVVEVPFTVNHDLFTDIREVIYNGFSRHLHLRTTVFQVPRSLMLCKTSDYRSIMSMQLFAQNDGLLHEYLIARFCSSRSGYWHTSFFVRAERDKTHWFDFNSGNLTEEYIKVCFKSDPLVEADSSLRAFFEVNPYASDDRRPTFRQFVSTLDQIRRFRPQYDLLTANCYWFAQRCFDHMLEKVGADVQGMQHYLETKTSTKKKIFNDMITTYQSFIEAVR